MCHGAVGLDSLSVRQYGSRVWLASSQNRINTISRRALRFLLGLKEMCCVIDTECSWNNPWCYRSWCLFSVVYSPVQHRPQHQLTRFTHSVGRNVHSFIAVLSILTFCRKINTPFCHCWMIVPPWFEKWVNLLNVWMQDHFRPTKQGLPFTHVSRCIYPKQYRPIEGLGLWDEREDQSHQQISINYKVAHSFEFFHNFCLISWIQQFIKKIRDWTQIACWAVSHSNLYTRIFSAVAWCCNWIIIHAQVILSNLSNSSNSTEISWTRLNFF